MTTSWSSLYLDFSNSMTDYIARHVANYSRVQTCLDYLYSITGGAVSALDVPIGLQEIFDRNGIIGKDSYKPPSGTKTGPDYDLIIPAGAFWSSVKFYRKSTSSTIPLSGYSTGTYYVQLDGAGNPSLVVSGGSMCVWKFDWSTITHQVTNVLLHSGVYILFDGDDYQASLYSTAYTQTFQSIAERFDFLEALMDQGDMSSFFAYDEDGSSGLDFAYKAGLVRNDNVVWTVVADTITLTASDTSYIEVDPASGVVSANLVGFTAELIPLYEVVCSGSAIISVTDKRTWCAAGGPGGGGGHAQNTDLGTSNEEFKLLYGSSGAPTQDALLKVERGTSTDVAVKWNETLDKWQYTEDGTTWKNFGELDVDLGAQEISKYVALDNPPLAFEELTRGSSGTYEEIDLTSLITDAPDGIDAAVLRIVFWDSETPPSVDNNVRFRKGGIGPEPIAAYTLFSPAELDWSRPQALVLGVSTDNKIEFYLNASGGDTANLRVYLVGYFKKILGVGTQNVQFVAGTNVVAADSTVDFNLTNFANRALVYYLKLEEVGDLVTGDYDIEIYANDTFDAAGLLYKAVGIHPDQDYEDWLPWFHVDGDSSKELHIRIINKDLTQTGTFDITIRCEMFA